MSTKPRTLAALVLAMLILAPTIAWTWFRPPEPAFEGKPLRSWIRNPRTSVENTIESRRAVAALGPSATSALLTEIRREDSLYRTLRRGIWALLPSSIQKRIPQPFPRDDLVVLGVSQLLGYCATAPQLTEALNDQNADVRLAVLWTLADLATVQTNIAVRPGVELLKDPDEDVQISAALLLANLRYETPQVAPLLIQGLQGNGRRVRIADQLSARCAESLGHMGNSARSAIPDLAKLFRRAPLVTRSAVATALWRLDSDTNALRHLAGRVASTRKSDPNYFLVSDQLLRAVDRTQPPTEVHGMIADMVEFPPTSLPSPVRTQLVEKARRVMRQLDPALEARLKTYTPSVLSPK